MILQALVDYYEILAKKGKIARPGWAKAKISYALELDAAGRLIQIHPLKRETQVGKKLEMKSIEMELPAPAKRTVGISANLLWDNSAYMLGIDGKGNPDRAKRCFQAAKEFHHSILGVLENPAAKAVCAYFETWDVCQAQEHPEVAPYIDDLFKGGNLVFLFDDHFASEQEVLVRAWQTYYDGNDPERLKMCCLITGEKTAPMPVHPSIKGVQGAQSSGAALVSFNAPAFCSYEREQNLNAPVGKYAAFAYTTALNQLLSDSTHVKRMGDTTVVYWAEDGESSYQDAFSFCLDGGDENQMTDQDLDDFMDSISKGNAVNWDGIPVNPDNRFYVLGLAPNAARLSVRFFLRDGFGNFVRNIRRHYQQLEIAPDGKSKRNHLPLWLLLRETINEKSTDKAASPQMTGDIFRAILTGCSYPATLYQQTQLRIRAERNITRGRAAIIKAYLLRNTESKEYKEALIVKLNEGTTYQPYVLGRLFSVAEAIQERASGVTSIKDKYFSSACATPSVIVPMVLNLADKHLKKLDGGMRTYYAKQLGELMAQITESYPAHHNLYDQGIFQLGYYHQTQKRFEKKSRSEPEGNFNETKEEI